jgi:hypothetical protein
VVAEQRAWDEAAPLAAEARRHASEASLEALPAHAAHLEGRAAAAGGATERAVAMLEDAAGTFVQLGARWDAAAARLALAGALASAGRTGQARSVLDSAALVFAQLGSPREEAAAEALRVRLS